MENLYISVLETTPDGVAKTKTITEWSMGPTSSEITQREHNFSLLDSILDSEAIYLRDTGKELERQINCGKTAYEFVKTLPGVDISSNMRQVHSILFVLDESVLGRMLLWTNPQPAEIKY